MLKWFFLLRENEMIIISICNDRHMAMIESSFHFKFLMLIALCIMCCVRFSWWYDFHPNRVFTSVESVNGNTNKLQLHHCPVYLLLPFLSNVISKQFSLLWNLSIECLTPFISFFLFIFTFSLPIYYCQKTRRENECIHWMFIKQKRKNLYDITEKTTQENSIRFFSPFNQMGNEDT